jgi:hypothetical protein
LIRRDQLNEPFDRHESAWQELWLRVTAAVVGLVLNLAGCFGLHVIFPSANTVDRFDIVVGVAAFIGMTRWDIIPIVLGAGLVGLLFKMLIWRNA